MGRWAALCGRRERGRGWPCEARGAGGPSLLDGPATSGSRSPFLVPTPFPRHPVVLTPKLLCFRGSRRRGPARKKTHAALHGKKTSRKAEFLAPFLPGFSFKTNPLGVSTTEPNLREKILRLALFLNAKKQKTGSYRGGYDDDYGLVRGDRRLGPGPAAGYRGRGDLAGCAGRTKPAAAPRRPHCEPLC